VNALFEEAELGCQIEQTFTSSIASVDFRISFRLFLGFVRLESRGHRNAVGEPIRDTADGL
jgi:hypothetical protein